MERARDAGEIAEWSSEESQDSVARKGHEERVCDEEALVVHLEALHKHHCRAVRAPEHSRHRKERPQKKPDEDKGKRCV